MEWKQEVSTTIMAGRWDAVSRASLPGSILQVAIVIRLMGKYWGTITPLEGEDIDISLTGYVLEVNDATVRSTKVLLCAKRFEKKSVTLTPCDDAFLNSETIP